MMVCDNRSINLHSFELIFFPRKNGVHVFPGVNANDGLLLPTENRRTRKNEQLAIAIAG